MTQNAHHLVGVFYWEANATKIISITLREANAFIEKHHRHNGRVQGCKFCVAVADDLDAVHGVAIVGRPVARRLDDGKTAEVTRLCTDGIDNGCSFLYSRCARIAKLMGYQKIITYTLATENGASLRASGWQCAPGLRGGGNWNVPGRPRADSRNTGPKRLYYKELR
ncbi:XF1762 family protein [Eisenbergiella porci]|nr:XF1762 family protein [Eisenbergiella porci]